MNFVLDMLLLFVVLTVLLIFNIPDLTSNNLLLQQIFIYFVITGYYIIQQLFIAKLYREPIDKKKMFKESLTKAIPCLFGFILFTDLRIMDKSKDFISKITNTGAPGGDGGEAAPAPSLIHFDLAYIVSLFIILFTIFAKMFTMMFDIETYA